MYLVKYIPFHKPWRGHKWFVTKEVFEVLNEQQDVDFHELRVPEAEEEYGIWEFLETGSEGVNQSPEYPYLLEGEVEFYGD